MPFPPHKIQNWTAHYVKGGRCERCSKEFKLEGKVFEKPHMLYIGEPSFKFSDCSVRHPESASRN